MIKNSEQYCCSKCKGTNIVFKAWVNVNTNKFVTETEDDTVWCLNCNKEVIIEPIT